MNESKDNVGNEEDAREEEEGEHREGSVPEQQHAAAEERDRRAEHRARAAGGAHLQHLPSMRAFDARATYVEAGSAEMANAYRRRRMMAVTFGRWLGGMHLPGPQEEPEGLAEEPRPADLFVRQATVQHV